MNGSSISTGTAFVLSADEDPIVLGASQTQSGDGTADNLKAHFDGTIHHFALYDWPVADGLVPCFVAGSLIETAAGPRPVETLHAGDLLVTRDHGLQPLILRDRNRVTADQLATTPKRRPGLRCR